MERNVTCPTSNIAVGAYNIGSSGTGPTGMERKDYSLASNATMGACS